MEQSVLLSRLKQTIGTVSMNLSQLRSDLVVLLLGATAALGFGILINQFRETPLPLFYQSQTERLQDSVQQIAHKESSIAPIAHLPEKLSLEDFSSFVRGKQALILDVRPKLFYRAGHVPGSLNLPRDNFKNAYAALKEKLEVDRSQPIVIYCFGLTCEDSALVRKSLASL
ncbi:MAG: rhodanese-like domain-containing protein [Terrimicrobiaceae bacterium]